MRPIWFVRMARWARNPPSPRVVMIWAGVVALCLGIVGFELLFGWPEALTVHRGGVPRVPMAP